MMASRGACRPSLDAQEETSAAPRSGAGRGSGGFPKPGRACQGTQQGGCCFALIARQNRASRKNPRPAQGTTGCEGADQERRITDSLAPCQDPEGEWWAISGRPRIERERPRGWVCRFAQILRLLRTATHSLGGALSYPVAKQRMVSTRSGQTGDLRSTRT